MSPIEREGRVGARRAPVAPQSASRARTPGQLLARKDAKMASERKDAAASPMPEPPLDWDKLAPRGLYARFGQRALCLTLIALSLPIVLPLCGLVALANLAYFRDPRRILFLQERVGRRDTRFRIYKFRTMSEASRSTFEHWSSNDAARVTRLGRLLRNTHLDELPQLYNVVRGDMSLFGPRPEMVEVDAWAREHVPGFARRLAITPGLSGLSQITQGYAGRDVDAYRDKLEGDLAYLASYGLAQDLGILARTLVWMVRGRGWRWRDNAGAEPATQSGPQPATQPGPQPATQEVK